MVAASAAGFVPTHYPVNCMDPLKEYLSRRERWRAEQVLLQWRFIQVGNWRLGLGILEVALAVLVFGLHVSDAWLLVTPLLAFIALVIWHQRIIRRRTLAERAIRYYEDRLARLEDRWMGAGNSGDRFRDSSHVYADDLDVFGKGGLFELIASVRTAAGEQTLANWLLFPASRLEALARQEAVRELCPHLNLREDIALVGEDVRAEVHTETLANWGSEPEVTFAPYLRLISLLLAFAGVTTVVLFYAHALPLWPLVAVLGCDFILITILRKRVIRIVESSQTPLQGLNTLSLLLARLERENFQSPRLRELRAALQVEGVPASKRIARLQRWIDLRDSGEHLVVRILRAPLLWNEQVAMGIEAWRRENGRLLGPWLASIAELEALSSLAALSFERPQWSFPVLTESVEPCFEAESLQHPLIAPSKCVPNDLMLGGNLRLLIVSGSNMSGKSTLLRSAGLNCVLAWAGAPVAAKGLHISALQPGASIRITDSLQDNRSRFFSEITRIRQIVELTQGSRPVLFLLDELLSGTNSHDRRIGAAGIVRKLVDSGAIGLITTHDLALADIEQDLGSRAGNVHFDDRAVDGHIDFDYVLRPGIVTRSNALALMHAIGLDV